MSCYANSTCISPTTGTAPQIFTTALQYFAAMQCLISDEPIPDCNVPNFETFDIIIIGAGSAGCVLANRLSEEYDWCILVIEAGDDPPVESKVPGLDKGIFATQYDWQYLSTNDGRINQANINGSIRWPRGKMIGGCSNINAMIYIKGNTNDYQKWFDAGNKDWHPDIVEKYFHKAESYQYRKLLNDPKIFEEYGHNGILPLNIFNSTYRDVTDCVLDAYDEMNIKKVSDLNSANVMGSGILVATAANGIRQSTDRVYLRPAIKENRCIKVMKNAFVLKILVDKYHKAYGVLVERNGKIQIIYASLEIIVSAGTVNSPQLLMLSGIGPKQHLESKNISCLVDLPMVGKNLQDHLVVPVTIYGKGPDGPTPAEQNLDAIKYLFNSTGYLAQSSLSDILAFFSARKNAPYPDYQAHLSILWKNSSNTYNVFANRFRFKSPIPDHIAELNKNYTLFYFLFTLLHPESRGCILLNSNNPKDHPKIYTNYFSNCKDLDAAVAGLKILTEIVKTSYFRSKGAFLGRMKWPDCDFFELNSDDYWKCICIYMVLTVYHPVGTCAMGLTSKTSVVDSRLRVHGVLNLRVIDASVMPYIVSGNTNGPTIMLAERAADLVKQDHNRKTYI